MVSRLAGILSMLSKFIDIIRTFDNSLITNHNLINKKQPLKQIRACFYFWPIIFYFLNKELINEATIPITSSIIPAKII